MVGAPVRTGAAGRGAGAAPRWAMGAAVARCGEETLASVEAPASLEVGALTASCPPTDNADLASVVAPASLVVGAPTKSGCRPGFLEAAPVGPPGGKVGSLIVGAAVGLGGKLIRTVSFFGWTLPVSFFGGSAPLGGRLGGRLSAITYVYAAKISSKTSLSISIQ